MKQTKQGIITLTAILLAAFVAISIGVILIIGQRYRQCATLMDEFVNSQFVYRNNNNRQPFQLILRDIIDIFIAKQESFDAFNEENTVEIFLRSSAPKPLDGSFDTMNENALDNWRMSAEFHPDINALIVKVVKSKLKERILKKPASYLYWHVLNDFANLDDQKELKFANQLLSIMQQLTQCDANSLQWYFETTVLARSPDSLQEMFPIDTLKNQINFVRKIEEAYAKESGHYKIFDDVDPEPFCRLMQDVMQEVMMT